MEDQIRSEQVGVFVTPDEKAAIEVAARSDSRTTSTWMRIAAQEKLARDAAIERQLAP